MKKSRDFADVTPHFREKSNTLCGELLPQAPDHGALLLELLTAVPFVAALLPATLPGLCTRRVLVMTFMEGVSLRDGAALAAAGVDRDLLLLRVCEAWASQMFIDGVFNGARRIARRAPR